MKKGFAQRNGGGGMDSPCMTWTVKGDVAGRYMVNEGAAFPETETVTVGRMAHGSAVPCGRKEPRFGEWLCDPAEAKRLAWENDAHLLVFVPGGCPHSWMWMERIGEAAPFLQYCKDNRIVLLLAGAPYGASAVYYWRMHGVRIDGLPAVFMFKVPSMPGKGDCSLCFPEVVPLATDNSFIQRDSKVFARAFREDEFFFDVYTGDRPENWSCDAMMDIIDSGRPYRALEI